MHMDKVTSGHLLQALLRDENSFVAKTMAEYGITYNYLREQLKDRYHDGLIKHNDVFNSDEDEFDENAETVHKIYSDICSLLKAESTSEAFDLFNDKIREFKYWGFVSEDRTRFVYKSERTFEVDNSFPRLDVHGDALSIGSVVYELKLDTLKQWEINDLWQRL